LTSPPPAFHLFTLFQTQSTAPLDFVFTFQVGSLHEPFCSLSFPYVLVLQLLFFLSLHLSVFLAFFFSIYLFKDSATLPLRSEPLIPYLRSFKLLLDLAVFSTASFYFPCPSAFFYFSTSSVRKNYHFLFPFANIISNFRCRRVVFSLLERSSLSLLLVFLSSIRSPTPGLGQELEVVSLIVRPFSAYLHFFSPQFFTLP